MPPQSDSDRPLRIGILGGVPPALGGRGLEVQIDRTVEALEALGHQTLRVAAASPEPGWDLVHAFGGEGAVQNAVEHWSRNRVPLVLSPVLGVSPGVSELAVTIASRWRAPMSHAAVRRRLLRRADRLVAITGYEARVLRRLAGRRAAVAVIPNGAEAPAASALREIQPGPYALMLGAVSRDKGQAEVLGAINGALPVVVAGAWAGTDLTAWEAVVRRTGATWLGYVDQRDRIGRLLADATALIHLSSFEVQSLAVLEALAARTPVIVSDIPSHREMKQRWPAWVHVVPSAEAVPAVLARLRDTGRPSQPAAVPGWGDVANQLVRVYRSALR